MMLTLLPRCSLFRYALLLMTLISLATPAFAEVTLPSLFTDHMVLQRDMETRVWGSANAGEAVTVTIAGQTQSATADEHGRWQVKLASMPAGGPHELVVEASNRLAVKDVLVGEVWLCSGQSNMQWSLNISKDAELERLAAKFPQIRMITVPQIGSQNPQEDFYGSWQVCSPETINEFSAVAYFFGRQLHRTLDVPIGLIDNSWGGSAAEAWIRRDLLQADAAYQPLLARWAEMEGNAELKAPMDEFEKKLSEWQQAKKQAQLQGAAVPNPPAPPNVPLSGNHRPGNLYNGVLKPVIGYAIRGAIWYQGESNASRAYQYRQMFPLMIQSWRDEWGQGDFSFYWVQLADFLAETPEPQESAWAELREAQTMTLKMPATGQAVIIDTGEANDIHPRNKQDVGKRLARIALAKNYGVQISHQSPLFKSVEISGNKAVVTFEHVGGGLRAFDVNEVRGFAIAGEDRKFVWAQAKIVAPDRVEVWSDAITAPVAVRYAWADNPVSNLQTTEGLPATPFRSDDWPGVTASVQ